MHDEKELQQLIGQLQLQNQQLQNILLQKQALTVQGKEIEKALEELENSKDDVYKFVGPILVKTSKEAVKKDMEETKDDIELKLHTLEKQENKIKDRIKEAQEKFQGAMPERRVGEGG